MAHEHTPKDHSHGTPLRVEHLGHKRHSKKPKNQGLKSWKVGIILVLFAAMAAFLSFFTWAILLDLPDFSLFEQRKLEESTKIYDRTGKILLFDVHKDIKRTSVPLSDVSPLVQKATIAIEDDQFYEHFGIRPLSILRAILANIQSGGYAQGGSTITQQVIKNALLSNEKSVTRKVKEWILAIKLERTMTKDQILERYFNEAPYGGNIYGVEEAAQTYFGKSAKDVSLAEAAYLAALPQSPTRYSPYGTHKDELDARKNAILQKLRKLGWITTDEYDAASTETVAFRAVKERGIRAPHFVMYIKQELADRFGDDAVENGGLRVTTTLDAELQEEAEAVVQKYGDINEKAYKATNDALVATDPRNGDILVMVGSRDYFNMEREGNYNIALAERQPGSSFKPFVYAAAFEKGYTPDTVLFDTPTQFSTACDAFGNPRDGSKPEDCYMPVNYDGKYRGPVTIRNALAQSLNVPAVKMLYLVGISDAISFAKNLGITTLGSPSRYGLTLVLGGGEVSLLEMVGAYGAFAHDGTKIPLEGILSVVDSDGKTIYEQKQTSGVSVMSQETARMISSVLSDNNARIPAFGATSALYFPDRDVAVKTGTTNDYRDVWIVGYTPSIVVGAWAGNNDNHPMEKKVAGMIIAPLWHAFMEKVFAHASSTETFPEPAPLSIDIKPALRGVWYATGSITVDKTTGGYATDATLPENKEVRQVMGGHDILYWVNKDDPTGPPPANPGNDPQYQLWEIPAERWITTNGIPSSALVGSQLSPFPQEKKIGVISFSSPTLNASFLATDKVPITLSVSTTHTIQNIDLYVNTTLIGTLSAPPYEFSFVPKDIGTTGNENEIIVIAHDTDGNTQEERLPIKIQ